MDGKFLTKKSTDFTLALFARDENWCFPCGRVVDKEIITKISSLIRGIEREGYLSSWLVAVEQHRDREHRQLPSERKACCCVVALAG